MISTSPHVKKDMKTLRSAHLFNVGDRVITQNCRLGTVIKVAEDDLGKYIIVRLDVLPGEFAYDCTDLVKVN